MSIIAATAFHFRVRNGNGCFHSAKSPEQKIQSSLESWYVDRFSLKSVYGRVWQDLNLQRLATESNALPIELHPVSTYQLSNFKGNTIARLLL